ncbi:YciI family protein [Nocardioides sp. cx-173]|uniref:YciI family protein n=1 Tax=Nocardioides sp. cx-173 TaxID=2898796 RepID=UPI001E4A2E19|nr:YciI family protein [Nocardioides sp. cx-173]MCD4526470.1 YciI family protein [Nocardioides sp. cx-173]UGB41158.1 YciI family protein [Nocardioides sp. cx-173]
MTESSTTYVILLPGDESAWEAASEEEKQAVYAVHQEFSEALEARGHTITGGLELGPSREARTLRTAADGSMTVTDGPYAEAAEQLTGFYVVESSNLDDLVEVCRILGRSEGAIEIRAKAAS